MQLKLYQHQNPTLQSSNNDLCHRKQCISYLIQELVKMADYGYEIIYEICPESSLRSFDRVLMRKVQHVFECDCG